MLTALHFQICSYINQISPPWIDPIVMIVIHNKLVGSLVGCFDDLSHLSIFQPYYNLKEGDDQSPKLSKGRVVRDSNKHVREQ